MQQRREAARIPGRIIEEEELESPKAPVENLPDTRQPKIDIDEGDPHTKRTKKLSADPHAAATSFKTNALMEASGDEDNGTPLPDTDVHTRIDVLKKPDDGGISSTTVTVSAPGDDCCINDVSNTNPVVRVDNLESEGDDFVEIMRGLKFISSVTKSSSTGSSSPSLHSKSSRCIEGESLRDFLIEELTRTNRSRTSECSENLDTEYQNSLIKLLRYID